MAVANAFSMVLNWRFTPHVLLVLVQVGFSFVYFITEAAFNRGLNPHIYVTYRYVTGSLVMVPVAYFLERKVRPKITFPLFLEMFVLSLLGASLTLNMYFASLRYTSPAFVTSIANTIPSITFILAIILRLEVVDIRNRRGIAKILGTILSLAGVLTITLYKGPELGSLQGSPVHIRSNPTRQNWILGSFLVVASCMSWSLWFIMQAYTLKRYPAHLSLTAWMNFVGAAQSAVFTACIQHKPAAWLITLDVEFWSIVYSGIICCGFGIFIQLWCTKRKGPVFVTTFGPLSTVAVAILAYFLFGEPLRAGCILGGAAVILGLYLLLWGKEADQILNKSQEQYAPTCEEEKVTQEQKETAGGREVV